MHSGSSLSGVTPPRLLATRQTPDEILRAYPYLEAADIDEALRYAASLAETIEIVG
jgi:uncharacterized protein (DUF433 family)